MNVKYLSFCSCIALGLSLTGCGDSGSTGTGNNTTPSTTPPAGSMTTAPADTMTPATTPAMTPSTMPAMITPVAPPMPPATPTTAPAASDMATAKTEADGLIAQGIQYVKDNKLDLASQAVDKLEGMKGSLPSEYGPKIDQLKQMLDVAKMGGGKMPAMKVPGM